jgi:hypothetical protein
MSFKSPIQPLCHYCGKPIAKHTQSVYVRDPRGGVLGTLHTVEGPLHSKEECQRTVSDRVVSVSYEPDYSSLYVGGRAPGTPRLVASFTTWDGESWRDEFFCNGTCAARFAYLMARSGHCTTAYNMAVRQTRTEEAA